MDKNAEDLFIERFKAMRRREPELERAMEEIVGILVKYDMTIGETENMFENIKHALERKTRKKPVAQFLQTETGKDDCNTLPCE